MSFERPFEFTKENVDTYLKAVAKEYRRRVGKNMPAELILVGGASVLINYGFRQATTDIDAVIEAASSMKDAVNCVRDQYGLPNGWLNADFQRTESFSPKLAEFSIYYKPFSNVVTIRTISAEYLIAMKLRAGREYKNDLSDVLGILAAHEKRGTPISIAQIQRAVSDLYGNWEILSVASKSFIINVINNGHFEELYKQVTDSEQAMKEFLMQYEQEHPGALTESNVGAIAGALQEKTDRTAILARLKKMQNEGQQLKRIKGKSQKPER